MKTYFIAFSKVELSRSIRAEFAIPAMCKEEARTIAEREAASLRGGYAYHGGNY